jgi:uncharacterized protein (DUF1015 family)
MAEIHPFRAYRYDTDLVALADVLTQPYDKITPAMHDAYYAASPYNLIAVEKGRTSPDDTPANNVYTRAAAKVDEWIAAKILRQDAVPAIYVYSQEFLVPQGNTRRTRIGFVALARVEDYDAKVIFRHEHTLSGPKADRIELLRRTRLQTGQLFFLYDDRARQIDTWLEQIARTAAPNELSDQFGVTHRLWPVTDPAFVRRIQDTMAEKKLVIADGHHRYETALNYRNQCRERAGKIDRMAASEFAMATFINTHSRGLTILPTHRLVSHLVDFDFDRFRRNLSSAFDWYSYPFANADERDAAYVEFRKDLARPNHGRRAIGVYPGARDSAGAFYLFVLRRDADLETLLPNISEAQRELDVVLLHRLILEKGLGITLEAVAGEKHLTYEREMDVAIATVDREEAQLAFVLNPVRVEQVTQIALGGDVMPQKSTDFYPKLLSGIAIFQVEGRIAG